MASIVHDLLIELHALRSRTLYADESEQFLYGSLLKEAVLEWDAEQVIDHLQETAEMPFTADELRSIEDDPDGEAAKLKRSTDYAAELISEWRRFALLQKMMGGSRALQPVSDD